MGPTFEVVPNSLAQWLAFNSKQTEREARMTNPVEQTSPPELMDVDVTCAFFGGSRPIHPSTLYRGIRAGRYPAPVKLGPNIRRWRRTKCEEALRTLMNGEAA